MVGIIGGTFNPIHFGHLHLALSLMEAHALQEVWFIPSLQNPLKSEASSISFAHRYEMVKLAIDPIDQFKVLSIESERGAPSYTIDTVRALVALYPNKKFHLLLGDDHLESLKKWKEIETLLELAPPYFGTRYNPIDFKNHLDPLIKSLIKNGITKIPVLEISSTMVRDRLNKKLYCNHLLPTPVLDYIKQNDLYCLPYD